MASKEPKLEPAGYIRFLVDNCERFAIGDDDTLMYFDPATEEASPVLIDEKFRISLPVERKAEDDLLFMNPFKEGAISYTVNNYVTLFIPVLMITSRIQNLLLLMEMEEDELSSEFVTRMSKHVVANSKDKFKLKNLINKMLGEEPGAVMRYHYDKQHKITNPASMFFEGDLDAIREMFKCSKKTADIGVKMFRDIFEVDKEGDVSHLSSGNVAEGQVLCPNLMANSIVLRNLLEKLNPIFETIDPSQVVDIDEFDFHLEHIGEYAKSLNWLVPSEADKSKLVKKARKASSARKSASHGGSRAERPEQTQSIRERHESRHRSRLEDRKGDWRSVARSMRGPSSLAEVRERRAAGGGRRIEYEDEYPDDVGAEARYDDDQPDYAAILGGQEPRREDRYGEGRDESLSGVRRTPGQVFRGSRRYERRGSRY